MTIHNSDPEGTRMKAVVAERGQVTIPKRLRERLGIRPGTALEFSVRNGTLTATKAEADRVAGVYGCLGRAVDTDAFIRGLRGDVET